jgi:hypothetical protein
MRNFLFATPAAAAETVLDLLAEDFEMDRYAVLSVVPHLWCGSHQDSECYISDLHHYSQLNGKLVAFRLLQGDDVYYDLTLAERCFAQRIDALGYGHEISPSDRARLDAIGDRIGLHL